jgi:hypothetical protein
MKHLLSSVFIRVHLWVKRVFGIGVNLRSSALA